MSLEFTENKSSIGSGALNDLVLFMSDSGCRPVGDQSAISRRSDGERSATNWRSVGDWSVTVSWAFVFECRNSATFWRSVGNRSTTGRRSVGDEKLCRDCLQSLQLVGDQSPTSRRPVGDYQKPFYDRFGRREVSLAATQTSLRPNRPCNLPQPASNLLATTLQPPRDHPKFWSQGGRRPVASYVWPGLNMITLFNAPD